MMAMTIFMGSIPALARSCGLQGWAVYLGNGRAQSSRRAMPGDTNQTPCQFAEAGLSHWEVNEI
jgi:hypothetical protein